MVMPSKKEYANIDRFRVIAAFLVVTIHTSPLANFSETADFILTRILARVAVPFFFMASGFFLFSQMEGGKPRPGKLAAFTKKATLLYLIATLLYLPINLYAGTWQKWQYLPSLLKDIFFNGTFYHLWYLPAAIIGACIVWFLKNRMKTRQALLVCVILYVLGLLGDSYYGVTEQVPVLNTIYQTLFTVFDYTRNGLFFAPVFFMLGAVIRERQKPLPLGVCLSGLGASCVLMLAEGLLLHHLALQRHDSMYLILIPCMFFLFQSLLYGEGKSLRILRDLSMLIYLVHPAMIVAVRGLAKIAGLQALFIDNSLVHFLAVALFSTAVSLVLAMLLEILRKRDGGQEHTGRAWIEVNMESLQHNLQILRDALPKQCEIMAVVKRMLTGTAI